MARELHNSREVQGANSTKGQKVHLEATSQGASCWLAYSTLDDLGGDAHGRCCTPPPPPINQRPPCSDPDRPAAAAPPQREHRRHVCTPRDTATGPVTVATVTVSVAQFKAVIEPALNYLSHTKGYPGAVVQILAAADSDTRVALLEHLTKNPISDSTFHDRLCDYLPTLGTYFEVHLFLSMIKSQKAIEKALPLLKHEKFFVARRAFWYLDEQELPDPIRKKVDAFYEAHEARL